MSDSRRQVNLRLPSTLVDLIDRLAEKQDRSRQWLIEHWVAERAHAAQVRSGAVLHLGAAGGDVPILNPGAIDEADVEVSYVMAEGQLVNEGPRGVRIHHKPSGRTVGSDSGKSRVENLQRALALLPAGEGGTDDPGTGPGVEGGAGPPGSSPSQPKGPPEAQPVRQRAAGGLQEADPPHRHRFVKVPDTESPGRLLGTTEATYECVCGKSERRKVT